MTEISETADHKYADRIAGWALIFGALLSVFAMAHHPEHVDPNGLVGIVHGAMLVLMAVTAYGFAHFALRRQAGYAGIGHRLGQHQPGDREAGDEIVPPHPAE